jgi:hypothetical protein
MLTRGLDFATVHGKHNAGTPIQEALGDTFADETDCLTGKTAEVHLILVGVDLYFLEEDCYSLDWLLAERALGCGELEGVGDLVAEVANDECVAAGVFGKDTGLLLGVVEEASCFVSI